MSTGAIAPDVGPTETPERALPSLGEVALVVALAAAGGLLVAGFIPGHRVAAFGLVAGALALAATALYGGSALAALHPSPDASLEKPLSRLEKGTAPADPFVRGRLLQRAIYVRRLVTAGVVLFASMAAFSLVAFVVELFDGHRAVPGCLPAMWLTWMALRERRKADARLRLLRG